MKKTKLFAIALSACIIGLSACGEGTESPADTSLIGSESVTEKEQVVGKKDTETNSSVNGTKEERKTNTDNDDENGTTLPGVPQKYLEYLGNPDDETYFKPKTNDWVVWMKKDSLEVHITLLSFDETGAIVQYTDRRTNTDGSKIITKPNENQYKSADEMVFYWDYYASTNFMGNINKYKRASDKLYIFNEYGNNLYASKGLLEEDTRRLNPEDSDYQEVSAIGDLFGSDYYIELGEVSSHDAFIPDGVFGYDAFSYRHGELYCYDEKGKCVKFCEIILLDDASHIEAYNMCFYGAVHDKAWTYIKLDEDNYNKYVDIKNIKNLGRIIYMDYNDKQISSNEKKKTRLLNNDGYFSIPHLTGSQIEEIYKK